MPKKINLTNQIFGEWTVLREATKEEKNNKPGAYWVCKCSCGNTKIVSGQTLRNNQSKSCGCKTIEYIKEANYNKAENLSGKKYNQLTVIERDFEYESKIKVRGQTYWKCKCDCGNITTVGRNSLISGHTKSCGCLRQEQAKKILSEVSKNNYVDIQGQKFGKLTVLNKIDNSHSTRRGIKWLCQCDCGNKKEVFGIDLRQGNVSSCGCLQNSKGEYKIEQILKENNILFIKEYPFKYQNKNLRFDFAILNEKNNTILNLIEFDGKQHYEPSNLFGGQQYLEHLQENDKIKNNWCKENNIPLIRIPYVYYDNLKLDDLLLETSKFVYHGGD